MVSNIYLVQCHQREEYVLWHRLIIIDDQNLIHCDNSFHSRYFTCIILEHRLTSMLVSRSFTASGILSLSSLTGLYLKLKEWLSFIYKLFSSNSVMASSRFHAKKNNEYDGGHKFSKEYPNLQLF